MSRKRRSKIRESCNGKEVKISAQDREILRQRRMVETGEFRDMGDAMVYFFTWEAKEKAWNKAVADLKAKSEVERP